MFVLYVGELVWLNANESTLCCYASAEMANLYKSKAERSRLAVYVWKCSNQVETLVFNSHLLTLLTTRFLSKF